MQPVRGLSAPLPGPKGGRVVRNHCQRPSQPLLTLWYPLWRGQGKPPAVRKGASWTDTPPPQSSLCGTYGTHGRHGRWMGRDVDAPIPPPPTAPAVRRALGGTASRRPGSAGRAAPGPPRSPSRDGVSGKGRRDEEWGSREGGGGRKNRNEVGDGEKPTGDGIGGMNLFAPSAARFAPIQKVEGVLGPLLVKLTKTVRGDAFWGFDFGIPCGNKTHN